MPPFRSSFRRDGRAVELAVDGATVAVSVAGGAPEETRCPDPAVAQVIFENVARALEDAAGPGTPSCPPDLPGVLGDLGSDDDRTWFRVEGGALAAAHIYEADPVDIWDSPQPRVARGPRLPPFSPASLDPATRGAHAVRRFAAHPASARCPRLGIEVLGPYIDRLLDPLAASARADRLTHLWLHDPWDPHRGVQAAAPRPVGDQFPRLRMLALPFWSWPLFGSSPFPELDRLALVHGSQWVAAGKPWPAAPSVAAVLDEILALAPRLTHLRLHASALRGDGLAALLAHPLPPRLEVLDLFAVHDPLDLDRLLDARERLAGLRAIVVGAHLLPAAIEARFAGWPEVSRRAPRPCGRGGRAAPPCRAGSRSRA